MSYEFDSEDFYEDDDYDYIPIKKDPSLITDPLEKLICNLEKDIYCENFPSVKMIGLHEQLTCEKDISVQCNHEFVVYNGLFEAFNYCKHCNKKE
jgi:hypothetical protein